jgi:hypothetical protein
LTSSASACRPSRSNSTPLSNAGANACWRNGMSFASGWASWLVCPGRGFFSVSFFSRGLVVLRFPFLVCGGGGCCGVARGGVVGVYEPGLTFLSPSLQRTSDSRHSRSRRSRRPRRRTARCWRASRARRRSSMPPSARSRVPTPRTPRRGIGSAHRSPRPSARLTPSCRLNAIIMPTLRSRVG